MTFVRGNKAIRDHVENGKDLLLFETLKTKGQCRYVGSFVCDGWDLRMATDKNDAYRKAIVFRLIPLENIEATSAARESSPRPDASLEDMRRRAFAAADNSVGTSGKSQRNVYTRSRDIRDYVLARADGICEVCGTPAPFKRTDGTPYLEPHHTRRVSDGGPDHPRWVGAICPTCHRHIHHGADGTTLNDELQKHLGELEGTHT
jgi:5-methylcytosine-specific restriction enzyme A